LGLSQSIRCDAKIPFSQGVNVAYFLFIDESGHDLKDSPYAVLAGISVKDRDVWNLIEAVHNAEDNCFGLRYGRYKEEFKGKKFLKRKVFQHAAQVPGLLDAPARAELQPYAELVAGLRYRTKREMFGKQDFQIWSFAVIDDLRGLQDRVGGYAE
jgi:hypothetical protein